MNKTQLVEKVAADAQITKAAAKLAVEAVVAGIKDALVAGEKVQLVGFGTFDVKKQNARQGVNPATGKKIKIAAKKVAKFKPGKELAEAVK